VGRQYIGEIGKTDNGIVAVTTHLYDGNKSLPLDIELYQHASSLPEGNKDEEFKKKPELSLLLIDRSLERGYRPGIVLIDAGYGNNTNFLKELETRQLNYLGGLAKNRKIILKNESGIEEKIRLDELAKSLSEEEFEQVTLNLEKPKTVWVAIFSARLSRARRKKNFCARHEYKFF
jgi:SRSO17 transposase